MTANTRLGHVVRDATGVRLDFVRDYDASLDEVWSAVTDPERLARWFGRWSGDPTTGTVKVVMSAEAGTEPATVTIDACEPPRRLAVTLNSPDGPWPLELALTEQVTGTSLRFLHHLAQPYDASSIGPGWQFYLDRLGAEIEGMPAPHTWENYYPVLASAYPVPGDNSAT